MTGTQGVGVIKIESYEGLVATLQAMWKLEAEVLIQEFMPSDFDVRTFVVDNKIFASTKELTVLMTLGLTHIEVLRQNHIN